MTVPGTRLADYFFVAGVRDHDIIDTFETIRSGQLSEDVYYQCQLDAAQRVSGNTQPKAGRNHNKAGRRHTLSHSKTVPSHLTRKDTALGVLEHVRAVMDHFDKERDSARDTVIALHNESQLSEKYNEQKGSEHNRQRSASTPFEDRTKKCTAKSNENTMPNILDIKYVPTLLTRYPKKQDADNEFPAYISMVITDENGHTVNGTCVVFHEPLADSAVDAVDEKIQAWVKHNMSNSTVEYAEHLQAKILDERTKLEQRGAELAALTTQLEEIVRSSRESLTLYVELLEPVKMGIARAKHVWVPKCIGLLGRMAWTDLYSDWLRILLDATVGVRGHKNPGPAINIESAIYNILREAPLPPPGKFEIGLTLNHRPMFYSRPPVNQIPLLKNTLLAEGKVVFLSRFPGMLSLACETFRSLLFPFYWQFVFIPILPERLLTCLQAPVPYMVGFNGDLDDIEEYVPEDACIVNLDSNSVHLSKMPPMIPDRQRRKLQSALDQYAGMHSRFKVPYGVPVSVKEAFPNGRMLLSCGRSKIQNTFDAPSTQRNSDASDFSASIWSGSSISNNKRLSGIWSSTASSHSNDSSSSLPISLDMPTPSLPQYPGTAKLAATPQASTSSSSLSTPPMSPTTAQSRQRASVPLERHDSPGRNDHRRSDPPMQRSKPAPMSDKSNRAEGGKTRRRLSAFMTKPRAALQNNFDDPGMPPTVAPSPRISVSSAYSSPANGYDYTAPLVSRRMKHMEGHVMVEVLPQELSYLQGYRCLCGKQVSDDVENTKQSMFMHCQDCHLVTHDQCTDQILHACLPACFNERKVQEAFLRMFASLLYNYRSGFSDSRDVNGDATAIGANGSYTPRHGELCFSKERFLKHADKDSKSYLAQLVDSQMFTQFITDRLAKAPDEPEVLMFDEFIKLKLNRSKFKLVKEDTPFLNDNSYNISQTIWVTPPENKPPNVATYNRFPIHLHFDKHDE
ncbi:hypothetical protein BCR43DRAFT_437358 [Syncephalastrum racemosum]|uniref:UDENN domain-containing protein n=1 Tax=Syncephalastrum racemosum TaxID=13706 RepID=A0A1X2HH28_SYNRA|nr:hypothetical protein BCR43DRAFT_437358 [Syncephalastrum racemosum]